MLLRKAANHPLLLRSHYKDDLLLEMAKKYCKVLLQVWAISDEDPVKQYLFLVYTAQVNSAFRARWLASSVVISQVPFTSEQPNKNKMASRFK